jgi:exo-beta-1,3-glucanase (GH17 family)
MWGKFSSLRLKDGLRATTATTTATPTTAAATTSIHNHDSSTATAATAAAITSTSARGRLYEPNDKGDYCKKADDGKNDLNHGLGL